MPWHFTSPEYACIPSSTRYAVVRGIGQATYLNLTAAAIPTGRANPVGCWPHQFDTQEAGGADTTDVQEIWFAGSHWGTCLHHASWVRFRIRTPTLESTG